MTSPMCPSARRDAELGRWGRFWTQAASPLDGRFGAESGDWAGQAFSPDVTPECNRRH